MAQCLLRFHHFTNLIKANRTLGDIVRIGMKQHYRSEIGMISDILSVAVDYGTQGAIISSIARQANLTHYTAVDKCQKLIDFGLMTTIDNGKNRNFVVTEKGIIFFQNLQKFVKIAQEINIRF